MMIVYFVSGAAINKVESATAPHQEGATAPTTAGSQEEAEAHGDHAVCSSTWFANGTWRPSPAFIPMVYVHVPVNSTIPIPASGLLQ